MSVCIFIVTMVIAAAIYLCRKTTPCRACGRKFSRLDAMNGRLTITTGKIMCKTCADAVPKREIIAHAILEHCKIIFKYTTPYGTSTRTVDPYFIESGRLHGWDNQYDDRRTFSIHIMKDLREQTENYEYNQSRADIIRDDMTTPPEDLGFIVYRKGPPSTHKP